jgi:hypothetical protein
MSNNLILTRLAWINGNAVECPEGTYGLLKFPTGEEFYTCERPWKNNKPFVSCIPTGVYYLEQRYSPVVQRTSGGEFSEGWEVTDVRDRDYIMIHPGNWPSDVEGCIAVGKSLGIRQNKQGKHCLTVLDSRQAFREIMELMDTYNTWVLDIRSFHPETF